MPENTSAPGISDTTTMICLNNWVSNSLHLAHNKANVVSTPDSLQKSATLAAAVTHPHAQTAVTL
jgi:hypothetical protein